MFLIDFHCISVKINDRMLRRSRKFSTQCRTTCFSHTAVINSNIFAFFFFFFSKKLRLLCLLYATSRSATTESEELPLIVCLSYLFCRLTLTDAARETSLLRFASAYLVSSLYQVSSTQTDRLAFAFKYVECYHLTSLGQLFLQTGVCEIVHTGTTK